MKAIYWDDSTQGMKFETREVPANLLDEAKKWREKMVEAAAEADDELMHKYLEGHNLSNEDIKKACASAPSRIRSCRCCAAPHSRTRACRRCSTP